MKRLFATRGKIANVDAMLEARNDETAYEEGQEDPDREQNANGADEPGLERHAKSLPATHPGQAHPPLADSTNGLFPECPRQPTADREPQDHEDLGERCVGGRDVSGELQCELRRSYNF